MRVLVACEFSGIVRDAFIAAGHDAVSCDLLPSERLGPHIQHDAVDVAWDEGTWDLMVAHPPCAHLAVSGARWFHEKQAEQAEALAFVQALLDAPIPRIALENPVSIISSRIRKPDQIIQPWMFGHGETKATCLWLKNLPKLQPTDIVDGRTPRVPSRLTGAGSVEGTESDTAGYRRRDGGSVGSVKGHTMTIDTYYAAMSDRNDRIDATRPHVYGGNVAVASLRAFRRYDRNATYDLPDAQGVLRWVTAKQLRVYGIIARISLSPDGRARMIDIAVEAQCHTSTVSRTILKVQAWGLYAVDVRRGRNGGITVFKPFGTWAAAYVRAARQRLREMAIRARIKLASLIQRGDDMVTDNGSPINDVMDASFSLEEQYERDKAALKARLRAGDEAFQAYEAEFVRRKLGTFGVKVWEERRRLAIEDPAGEGDAVSPLWGYGK